MAPNDAAVNMGEPVHTGTAPLAGSSGQVIRHRLSRADAARPATAALDRSSGGLPSGQEDRLGRVDLLRSAAECDDDGWLVGAAHQRELESALLAEAVQHLVKFVGVVHLAAAGGRDQMADPHPSPARQGCRPRTPVPAGRPAPGRPTALRSRRATGAGAMPTPRRGRAGDSPRASASSRRRSAAWAGIAR
jgi:hypothetical protein